MRNAIVPVALALSILVSLPSEAKTDISGAFDGKYQGSVAAVEALSIGTCNAPAIVAANIQKGMMTSPEGAQTSLHAIVTADGFVTGRVAIGAKSYPIEGRVNDSTFMGGLLTEDGRCAWLVTLKK